MPATFLARDSASWASLRPCSSFLLLRLTPGDPAAIIAGRHGHAGPAGGNPRTARSDRSDPHPDFQLDHDLCGAISASRISRVTGDHDDRRAAGTDHQPGTDHDHPCRSSSAVPLGRDRRLEAGYDHRPSGDGDLDGRFSVPIYVIGLCLWDPEFLSRCRLLACLPISGLPLDHRGGRPHSRSAYLLPTLSLTLLYIALMRAHSLAPSMLGNPERRDYMRTGP